MNLETEAVDWVKLFAVVVIGGALAAGALYLWNISVGKKINYLGPMAR